MADAEAVLGAESVFERFESIGISCEFGLLQRGSGIDRPQLLRFSWSPLPSVLKALRDNFDGLGVRLHTVEYPFDEYIVHDEIFGFTYHPCILKSAMSEADLLARERVRVGRLTQLTLQRLASHQYIFVYRGEFNLNMDEARELFEALCLHGPNSLLAVALADRDHQAGSVEQVSDGLYIGYIDRYAPRERADDSSAACWKEICRNCLAISSRSDRREPAGRLALV